MASEGWGGGPKPPTSRDPKRGLSDRLSDFIHDKQMKIKGLKKQAGKALSDSRTIIGELDYQQAMLLLKGARAKVQKDLREMTVMGTLTRFPLGTVVIFLLMTSFFMVESGAYAAWFGDGAEALNVRGDMEVYLPDGSRVKEDLNEVEENWTTNVMVIYVESTEKNISSEEILHEMDRIERSLNTHPVPDDGQYDDVIYLLSLSTVVKEVNSSAPRVTKAVFEEMGNTIPGFEIIADEMEQYIDEYGVLLGDYSIPDQSRIDQMISEIPPNALDKMVQNTDNDNEWDRAVILVGVAEYRDPDDIIRETQEEIDRIAEANDWEGKGLKMTLTGPVPLANAITKYSFRLFWEIFPVGIVLVALALFAFHSDFIQTGAIRLIQGLKVIVIAGLPTLCAVFWTLGIIGWLDIEVTMTIIVVGPILLALGVSYGLHITNRYAQEEGTPEEKMAIALQSTGKAVLLSAVTTIIGFISLTFTPMAPVKTVGWALSGGIVVVYFLTMVMVPNLTMLLDLRKPSHPPPKPFQLMVAVPVNKSRMVVLMFVVLMLTSVLWSYDQVEEDIDMLGMAPQDEPSVKKMIQYSREFEAGQVGMVLVKGAVKGDLNDDDSTNNDPYGNLQGIDQLESRMNSVKYSTAVSVVFMMKSVGVSVNVTGTPIWESINATCHDIPCDQSMLDVAKIIFDREESEDATFWRVLQTLDNPQSQIMLLNVFYDSLTEETRNLFVSEDYRRVLIYVDMPFLPMADTQNSVGLINEYTTYPTDGNIASSKLTGVAAVAIAVNDLIIDSQWQSLIFAVVLTLLALSLVFRDWRFALITTLPVVSSVSMQWLVMHQLDVTLSLVTVMIGSIVVGVGIDFSIHIANRVKELGGGINAVRAVAESTGMSLFEATAVTTAGLVTAYLIPIPELKPFVTVIIVLLVIAAASALLLLPAIFCALDRAGISSTGGGKALAKRVGLGRVQEEGTLADLVHPPGEDRDAW